MTASYSLLFYFWLSFCFLLYKIRQWADTFYINQMTASRKEKGEAGKREEAHNDAQDSKKNINISHVT